MKGVLIVISGRSGTSKCVCQNLCKLNELALFCFCNTRAPGLRKGS